MSLVLAAAFALGVASSASAAVVPSISTLPVSQNVLTLNQKVARPSWKADAFRSVTRKGLASSKSYTDVLAGGAQDEEYLTNITIGGQNFIVIVDTGSSDTWLAKTGFSCYNLTSYPEPQSECEFGPLYNPADSKTYKVDSDKNFNISYGDGEFLTGTVAFETVTVAGLTVTNQEIGVVTDAAWEGDGVSSGLIGLAYPGLTSVFNGTDPDDDSLSNLDEYDPFFFTAVKEGAVSEPLISVALNRGSVAAEESSSYDSNLGYIAFGGIAPVSVTKTEVTVPIQKTQFTGLPLTYNYYTIDVDSYVFPGSSKLNTTGTSILDTGTTLLYVPTEIAKAYNEQFVPKATFVADEDTYYVDCDATAPAFAVTIGGVEFSVTAADVILPIGDGECLSGIQDGGSVSDGNIFILGDVFLHNVVATFNLSSNVVTLTERTAY